MKLVNIDQILANESSERHVLLGNGFSMACKPNVFSYQKLWENAEKIGALSNTKHIFEKLKTADFERVMQALRDTAQTIQNYPNIPQDLVARVLADAEKLKQVLLETIARSHPDYPSQIPDEEYKNCRNFLSRFNKIFTTSYDLLLYWTIMHEPGPKELRRNDGFRTPAHDENAEYVSWEPRRSSYQNTFYLHGALHIFDTGTEVKKFTWNRTDIKLIDQIRDALNQNFFPLFVAEGLGDEKQSRIRHSDFLSKPHLELGYLKGDLIIFGHSLGESDSHILDEIASSYVERVFVGIFGDPDKEKNRFLIERANSLPRRRTHEFKDLNVFFYDSSQLKVWK